MKQPVKRPDGVTIFAIFFLLAGIAEIAGISLNLILLQTSIGKMMLLIMPYPYLITSIILDIIGIFLLFVSSYRLFNLKQWSRTLSIITATYLLIIRITIFTIVMLGFSNIIELSTGASKITRQIMSVYYQGLMIYSSIFGLALYIALIIYMSRKQTKQYFNNRKQYK